MDRKIYLVMNSGSVEKIFESEAERDEYLAACFESEKKYQVTHYYYYSEDWTLGEYVCERICKRHEYWKKEGTDDEIKYSMRYCCTRCPLEKYSKYMKDDPEEN